MTERIQRAACVVVGCNDQHRARACGFEALVRFSGFTCRGKLVDWTNSHRVANVGRQARYEVSRQIGLGYVIEPSVGRSVEKNTARISLAKQFQSALRPVLGVTGEHQDRVCFSQVLDDQQSARIEREQGPYYQNHNCEEHKFYRAGQSSVFDEPMRTHFTRLTIGASKVA